MISIGIFASLWWSAIDSVRLRGYLVSETNDCPQLSLGQFFWILVVALFGFVYHGHFREYCLSRFSGNGHHAPKLQLGSSTWSPGVLQVQDSTEIFHLPVGK